MSAATKTDLPAKREAALPAETGPVDITRLMLYALEKGTAGDLERLVALQNREQDRAAEREFNAALASFQAECPLVKRTSSADIASDSGRKFSYKYAEIDEIADTIRPYLHARGLSYVWGYAFADGERLAVCTLRHANGHSISASFPIILDGRPNKAISDCQKMAAPTTFAMRRALSMVLGLASTDADTDGAKPPEDFTLISQGQAADLAALVDEVKSNSKQPDQVLPRLLKHAGVSRIAEIRRTKYSELTALLEKMRGAKA